MYCDLFKTACAWAVAAVFDDAVSYWAFEETGNTIVDSKGVANMTIADATAPTRITGMVGNALQVNNGAAKYATTGADVNALDFDSRDDFSVAGWVLQHEGSPVFIKMENTVNFRGWHLQTGDDGKIDFLLRSTNATANKISVYGKGRVPMGEWVHLAATYHYDAADSLLGVRIYVNGELFDSTLTYGGIATPMDTTNTKPFQFTAREANAFLGTYSNSLDEVGVWERTLSQAEIQQLVNAGSPDVVVPPGVNYFENGDFEDTTGWVAPGTGVLPPAEWASHIWKNNPAAQATGTAAIGGVGNSAQLVEARLSGSAQRGMAQSFVHATNPEWQFDLDFASEAPSLATGRTLAMTLRTDNGAQLAFIISDPDNDGLGDLLVGGANATYELIPGLEDKIAFDADLSDVSGSVNHLRITGHFDDAAPNYDITLTDPTGAQYTVTGITTYSGDMGALVTGAGIGQVGFYTFASYGDATIDNVSLVNVPEPSAMILLVIGVLVALAGRVRKP